MASILGGTVTRFTVLNARTATFWRSGHAANWWWYTAPMKDDPAPSMHVSVRFFASLRELTGQSQTAMELPRASRAGDVWELCAARWPDLSRRRQSTVIAVNAEFARPDVVLQDGDEVAFLPPVSGGR